MLIGMMTFMSLLFLSPALLSAGPDSTTYRIIRIAFMNGCVRTLKSDLDTIRLLKENEEEMQRYVMLQTDDYVREVTLLNTPLPARALPAERVTASRRVGNGEAIVPKHSLSGHVTY
jgi:hypothetical protein